MAERTLLGRPLVHAIRYALDVALDEDTAWLEWHRDSEGEELLARLRPRLAEFTARDWAMVLREAPAVWRVLREWSRGYAARCHVPTTEAAPCAS